jgi:hypothetical protein
MHCNFGQNQRKIPGTLHEDLHTFLRSEVIGWGKSPATHKGEKLNFGKRQNF